jgi:hypothetical protein
MLNFAPVGRKHAARRGQFRPTFLLIGRSRNGRGARVPIPITSERQLSWRGKWFWGIQFTESYRAARDADTRSAREEGPDLFDWTKTDRPKIAELRAALQERDAQLADLRGFPSAIDRFFNCP